MRRFMMLAVLALVASLALAGAAAASASAAEIFLTNPTGVTYPQNVVTTDNNPSTLTASFITVTCTSLLGRGTLWSPKKLLLLLLWHGCKDNFGRNCLSTGEPQGLIHTLLLVLPVWLNKALTLPGVLFERHQGNADLAHFHCWSPSGGTTLVLVRGSVLGHIPKPAPKVKSHNLEVEILVKNGAQEFEKVEEGTAVDKLESSSGGGIWVSATEEVTKDLVEFETAGVEAEFR